MNIIKNFTNSAINHAMNSFRHVSHQKLVERMNICLTCSHFDQGRCNQCGCFLAVKTSWASEKCPIDKWGPDIDPSMNYDQPPQPVPQQSGIPKDCGCNKKNV